MLVTANFQIAALKTSINFSKKFEEITQSSVHYAENYVTNDNWAGCWQCEQSVRVSMSMVYL